MLEDTEIVFRHLLTNEETLNIIYLRGKKLSHKEIEILSRALRDNKTLTSL